MAQTKRKRQTKHRGNAAGVVEARGRTGRKPTDAERRKPGTRASAQQRREERLNKPPTWSGSAKRAGLAAVFFVVLVLLVFKQPAGSAIALGGFVLLVYIPMTYYTDLMLYRRRQAKKLQGGK